MSLVEFADYVITTSNIKVTKSVSDFIKHLTLTAQILEETAASFLQPFDPLNETIIVARHVGFEEIAERTKRERPGLVDAYFVMKYVTYKDKEGSQVDIVSNWINEEHFIERRNKIEHQITDHKTL